MVKDSRLCAAPRTSTLRASHVPSDLKLLSTGMTATLAAELDGSVPIELVAEIVRSVLDDSRQSALDGAAESAIAEARLRLQRFVRARTPR